MIDSKELRVGNWFKWVEIASMGYGYDQIRNGEDIDVYNSFKDPIPLSPELLEKCGFVKATYVNGWTIEEYYAFESSSSGFTIEIEPHIAEFVSIAYCEYLHQLQNLYYALTNNELNIEL